MQANGAFFGVFKLYDELISEAPTHAPPYGRLQNIHDVMWYKIELVLFGNHLFIKNLDRQNVVDFVTKGNIEQSVITALINHNGLATLHENRYYMGRCIYKKFDDDLLSVKMQIGKTLCMDVTNPTDIKVTSKLQRKPHMEYNRDDKFIHLILQTDKAIDDLFYQEKPNKDQRPQTTPKFCFSNSSDMDIFSQEELDEFRLFVDQKYIYDQSMTTHLFTDLS